MQQRDYHGRYKKARVTTRWEYLVCLSILGGIFLGLSIDSRQKPLVFVNEAVAASEPLPKPLTVMIEVAYSKEGIERLIRETFHEMPNTAVAIAKAEGGLLAEIQSHYKVDGIQEPSFCTFQIHEPSWMREAERLGYGDYKTNVESCIKMARVIYDRHGWQPWSAYKNGSYKQYL